jgi:hypothetical protein
MNSSSLHALPESIALPSAWSTRRSLKNTRQRRLGKQCIGKASFAECFLSGTRQNSLSSAREHSAKKSGRYGAEWRRRWLCRVSLVTLGKETAREGPHVRFFSECLKWHSAKTTSLPSASDITLGKEPKPVSRSVLFAECYDPDTRQRASLPSVTLGKVTSIYLIYLFFVFHPHKQKISHIYHIYTSQVSSQT